MAYLYLNFLDNLEKGSRSWDDFYTTSLTEQYDLLKRKLGRYAPDTLQELNCSVLPFNLSTPTMCQCQALSVKLRQIGVEKSASIT